METDKEASKISCKLSINRTLLCSTVCKTNRIELLYWSHFGRKPLVYLVEKGREKEQKKKHGRLHRNEIRNFCEDCVSECIKYECYQRLLVTKQCHCCVLYRRVDWMGNNVRAHTFRCSWFRSKLEISVVFSVDLRLS